VCENVETHDPSTTRGTAIMSLYVTSRQSVNTVS